MKYTNRWEMPEVTFYQVEDHGFEAHADRPLYVYGKPGDLNDHGFPRTGELFESLDRAMIAWVAEKYTGPRGAGGPGVGTAADWFMRMIGADQLVVVGDLPARRALGEVLVETQRRDGPVYGRANAMADQLEKRGLVLAALNHGGHEF